MAQLESKQIREIGCRGFADLIDRLAVYRTERSRHFDDVSRFIATASKRNRCQIRTVGFDQQSIQRHFTSHRAQIIGLLKSHHAGKRDHKAELHGRLSQIQRARKTMHDAARFRVAPLVSQILNRVFLSLTGVNYYWQLRSSCQLQLSPENRSLHFARRVVVMIIEPDLSPSQDFWTGLNQL